MVASALLTCAAAKNQDVLGQLLLDRVGPRRSTEQSLVSRILRAELDPFGVYRRAERSPEERIELVEARAQKTCSAGLPRLANELTEPMRRRSVPYGDSDL